MKNRGIQLVDNNDAGGVVLDLKINVVKDSVGLISSGLVLGNTLEQNKALILIAQPGDLKSNPLIGVGLQDILLSDELLEYRHKIREQYALDGLKITELDLYPNQPVKIEASYE